MRQGICKNRVLPSSPALRRTVILAADPQSQIAIATVGPLRGIRGMALAFDPGSQSGAAIPAAAQWVEAVLLGRVGTVLAVIAVAWVGYAMLTGPASPMIVSELTGLARSGGGPGNGSAGVVAPSPAPTVAPGYDHYAGAAVPGSGG